MTNGDVVIKFEEIKEREEKKTMSKWEDVKKDITIRFYSKDKAKNYEIKRSAKRYGFDDLVLVPALMLGMEGESLRVAPIKKCMLEAWGITRDTLFKTAFSNIKYTITGMNEFMRNMMILDGMPEDLVDTIIPKEEDMYIVSNPSIICGAVAVITAREELKTRFPEGYTVIPSSVHEVLVVPKTDGVIEEDLKALVESVNANVVAPEDKLSDNVYSFEGSGV